MTHSRRTVLRGIGAAGLTASVVGTAGASGGGDARYVVTAASGVERRLDRAGFDVRHGLAGGSVLIVEGPADERESLSSVEGVENAARDVQIAFEGPELSSATDTREEPLYDLQWDKQVTSAAAAHDVATGDGAALAILDTGVDHDHPDLSNLDEGRSRLFRAGEIREGEGEVEIPADGDEGGTITEERSVADDVHGHGSHVGGIAAAPLDDGGIVGTAPDASLVALRVFYYDEVGGEATLTTTTADILLAIDYAAGIGADAANMSLGTPPLPPESRSEGMHVAYNRVIRSATRRGTLVVASAGNDDADLQHGGRYSLPNGTPGAVSVSATGPNDERSFYSNYGANAIDLGAPGGGYETLEKTLATDAEWPFPTNLALSSVPPELYGGPYAYFAGTSMAAPQVTGIVGLVRELDPSANANRVEQAIKHGAIGADGESGADLGAGRVDALNAVELVSKKR